MDRLTHRDENGKAFAWVYADLENQAEVIKARARTERKVLEKLANYEDAEEEGRMIILPCKVGDTVYEPRPSRGYVQEYIITSIEIYDDSPIYRWDLKDGKGSFSFVAGFSGNAIGKTVFLTREAAEAALKEMEK